jgi:hypothetical protein
MAPEIESNVAALQYRLPHVQLVTEKSLAYASSIKRWSYLSQRNAIGLTQLPDLQFSNY